MKICPVGAELFHPTDGQTEMKKLIVAFSTLSSSKSICACLVQINKLMHRHGHQKYRRTQKQENLRDRSFQSGVDKDSVFFLVVTRCWLVQIYRRFEDSCCLHLQFKYHIKIIHSVNPVDEGRKLFPTCLEIGMMSYSKRLGSFYWILF